MKKTRLLIAVLVMLVAASGYAQDSYRQAVKDYLTTVGIFESQKPLISTLSMMFERNGDVDIDQLTKRYLDERFEDDLIDFMVASYTTQGLTEADLKELSSLLTTPEYKTYDAHQKSWLVELATYMLEPLMEMFEIQSEGKYRTPKSLERLETPVQPNAEIDAAYAEKFNQVMMNTPIIKNMKDAMIKSMDERMDQIDMEEPIKTESSNKVKDWMTKSLPAILLNSAYGKLTLEDLDYAARLYANEAYSKLQSYDPSKVDLEKLKMKSTYSKYTEWMKEQGAKESKDLGAAQGFIKSMIELIDSNKEDNNSQE